MEQSLDSVSLKQNHKLVYYFISNFYTSEKSRLDNLVSTSFKYSVDNGPEMDFEKYAKRKNFMQEHIQFCFDKPTTEDDIFFTAGFSVVVPRVDQPVLYCGGKMTFLVVRNLIERITTNYEGAGGDNSSVQDAIRKIEILNKSVKFV
ncbi:MAG: hypothetical protein HRU29_11735 [Rhizobiales bacterium]|nr:hypothetical protein [Hyphomicrobiales bacterium]NRB15061.1 hypothetical protein [Hyphomicrobiales bacterium]